jgi:hypothetical protein
LGSYQPGWKLGPVNTLSWEAFTQWIKGDTSTPLSQNAPVAKGDDPGHEFHGNQYTGGIGGGLPGPKGDKPLLAQSKGAKGGVHELLSTGHSFTMEELKTATGATESNIKTALSDLKSDKYAGKYGKLEITKDPVTGHYSVKQAATGVGKPEIAATKPISAENKASMEAHGLVPPSSSEAHDVVYNAKLNVALAMLASSSGQHADIQAFKDAKAAAMTQWASAKNGTEGQPAPQQVYGADKMLSANLHNGMSFKDSYDQWKKDTAAEKAGKPIGSSTKPESAGKPVGVSAQAPSTGAGEVGQAVIPSTEAERGIPKDTIPANYEHISAEEFSADKGGDSKFTAGMQQVHDAFLQSSKNTGSKNKAAVQSALTKELVNSPNFQTLKGLRGGMGESQLESALVSNWAGTSGDGDNIAVALQLSARDVFGMKDSDISKQALSALQAHGSENDLMVAAGKELTHSSTVPSADVVRAGLKEFVAGMYRNTQSFLASKGITEVYVARGMNVGKAEASISKVALQPMSSFTTYLGTAKIFGYDGSVFITRVPASQVVGSYLSGFGCTHEHELIVLAHKDMTAVRLNSELMPSTNKETSAYIQAQLAEKAKFTGSY